MDLAHVLFNTWTAGITIEAAIEYAKQHGFMVTEAEVINMYLYFAHSH